jgi:hypothetical protein
MQPNGDCPALARAVSGETTRVRRALIIRA